MSTVDEAAHALADSRLPVQEVFDFLETVGIDGIDEEDLIDDEAFDGYSPDEVEAALQHLRAALRIDDLGCYGVRLSLREWGSRLIEAVHGGATSVQIAALLHGSRLNEVES